MSNLVKIGVVAKLLGVSVATVQNREAEGRLLPHSLTAKGQRLYSLDSVADYLRLELSAVQARLDNVLSKQDSAADAEDKAAATEVREALRKALIDAGPKLRLEAVKYRDLLKHKDEDG